LNEVLAHLKKERDPVRVKVVGHSGELEKNEWDPRSPASG
jgi:hypothetical protein